MPDMEGISRSVYQNIYPVFDSIFHTKVAHFLFTAKEMIVSLADEILVHLYLFYQLHLSSDVLKRKEITELNHVIHFLSTCCENREDALANDEFREKILGLIPLFSSEEDGTVSSQQIFNRGLEITPNAYYQAQSHLLTALKSHRYSTQKLQIGAALNSELVYTKSKLFRMNDLLRNALNQHEVIEEWNFLSAEDLVFEGIKPRAFLPFSEVPYFWYYLNPKAKNDHWHIQMGYNLESFQLKPYYDSHSNWAKTVNMIENNHLRFPIENKSTQDIKGLFFQLYGYLYDVNTVCFRKEWGIEFYDPQTPRKIIDLAIYFQEELQDADSAALLVEWQALCVRWGNTFKTGGLLASHRQWQVLKKVAHVPPFPRDIPQIFEHFLHRLKHLFQQESMHPFSICAFIYFSLLAMRPFPEGNELVAMTFISLYLLQKGFYPLMSSFPLDVHKEQKEQVCAFIDWLKQVQSCIREEMERKIIKHPLQSSCWISYGGVEIS